MANRFLEQHFDPALKLPVVESREQLEEAERERLRRALAIVLIAGSIPRRLGGDATDEDLAIDRKRARRAAHTLSQSLKAWQKKRVQLPDDRDVRSVGAQLVWETFLEQHCAELKRRIALISTWAIHNGEERWGRSAIVKLTNELNWITYALRD